MQKTFGRSWFVGVFGCEEYFEDLVLFSDQAFP